MKSKPDIFKFSTEHGVVSIVQYHDRLELRADDQSLYSVVNRQNPHQLALKNLEFLLGVLLFIPKPRSILVLGTGGGSLIHFLRFHFPDSTLVSVELNAELQTLMHREMLLPQADNNLTYVIDDAAHYLEDCNQCFDLILIDLFIGLQSPPWLFECQSMRRLFTLLSNQGAVAYNLLIDSEHDFNRFYRNLRLIFTQKTLCLTDDSFDNTLAYAFRHTPDHRDIAYYQQKASEMGSLHQIDYFAVLRSIYSINPVNSGVI